MSMLASDHAVRDCEIVNRRIIAASPRGDNWNDWPTEMAIVSITEVDVTNPQDAYHYAYLLGTAMGGSGKMRQVINDRIPRLVADVLRKHGLLYHTVNVHFILGAAHGQVDDPETRNLLVLIDPMRDYDFKTKTNIFASPAIIVELGCDHNYDGEHPYGVNRGYYRAECTKCGYRYEVDSGD